MHNDFLIVQILLEKNGVPVKLVPLAPALYRTDLVKARDIKLTEEQPRVLPYMPSKLCVDWTLGVQVMPHKEGAPRKMLLGKCQVQLQQRIEWTR